MSKEIKEDINKLRKLLNLKQTGGGTENHVGGLPIAAGGFGCVFDPALKCKTESPSKPYDPSKVSKLMIKHNAKDELAELMKFAPILKQIPNSEKYFILDVTSCTPGIPSSADLKHFDLKCRNFKNKPEFREATMKKQSTLNKLVILNMTNGGVDLDSYIARKPINSDKLFNLVFGIKDIINNAVIPMNNRGLFHMDLKPANIVIDRNNQMRIIDWGLSDIVTNTKHLSTLLNKPLQYNNPYTMIVCTPQFFASYNTFVALGNSSKNVFDFVTKYYDYWMQHRGIGHREYLKLLLQSIYNKPISNANLREIVSTSIGVSLREHTNFKTRTFDKNSFLQIIYHNIDIWGAMVSFSNLFFKRSQDNIELPAADKNKFLDMMKHIIDKHLYFNFKKIDVNLLNSELDDVLSLLKPQTIPKPDIILNLPSTDSPKAAPVPPTQVKPKKTKLKKKKKLIILSNTPNKPSQKITVKKQKHRKPRCPNGTRRNPKTGVCEPVKDRQAFISRINSGKPKKTKQRKPRCPNGTRCNPKTGTCEPVQK